MTKFFSEKLSAVFTLACIIVHSVNSIGQIPGKIKK